jgi:hypothetical protein
MDFLNWHNIVLGNMAGTTVLCVQYPARVAKKFDVKELSKLASTDNNSLQGKLSKNTITGYLLITWKFSKLNWTESSKLLITWKMEDQEDMIKFRTDHYQEYRFHSVHDRQPTPFVQNIMTTSVCGESPSSPKYSPLGILYPTDAKILII